MITKTEIVKIITAIKIQCPEAFPYEDSAEFDLLVDVWFDTLRNNQKKVVWAAVRNALKNTIYQKQNWIGAICQEIDKIQVLQEKSDGELWAELMAAVKQVRKYEGFLIHDRIFMETDWVSPREEVKKIYMRLSPILKDYIGSENELVTLARQESFEYEKSRFIKVLPQLTQREKTRREINVFAEIIDVSECLKLL